MKFGTDGVRGRAHTDLTEDDFFVLGRAAGEVLTADSAVIGWDSRASGPAFASALAAGFATSGTTPLMLGMAPTPAIAHIAVVDGITGAVVSASHNPWTDNGIKFFGPGGRKLDDVQQAAVEAAIERCQRDAAARPASGTYADISDRVTEYVDHVVTSINGRRLDGMRVAIDAANGAASELVAPALTELGAAVTVIHAEPNGRNINDGCGSTYPDQVAAAVVAAGANVGLAFDGDADRVIAVDATGTVIDGDQVIAILARDLHHYHALAGDTVVVTVMTNLGFRIAMDEIGIHVHETPVGDRHLLEALEANGWSLGGEQSGHVIFRELATTGDGFLTGLQLLDVVQRSGRTLSALADEAMTRLPQVLQNLEIDGDPSGHVAALQPLIADVEHDLGRTGRVLVRPSGTEPLIRVMAEADSEEKALWAVETLLDGLRAL